MASHLFSRTDSAELVVRRRNRLRRVLLENLERRELMAVDALGYSPMSEAVSYSVTNPVQPLTFSTSAALQGLTGDQLTQYLDDAFGVTAGGDLTDREWFPLIQQRYDQWSRENGLSFSYSAGLTAEGEGDELIGEGEAGGPRLLSIAPNSGNIFSFNNVNTLTEAPTELVFRFDGARGILPSTIAGGIKLIRAGRDGIIGNGNDIPITPGIISFGENDKIVVMRFASTLPDDLYQVQVIGRDNAAAGEIAIRNTANLTLDARLIDSTSSDTSRDTVDFRLELGAQVVAVVPQPVDRLASNGVTLVQSGGSFTLRAHQSDITDSNAGTSVSLRLVQTGTVTMAAYDLPTNRITVSLAAGATVNDVVTAINSLSPNFSVTGVVNGAATVNSLDLGIRTVSFTNWALDPKRDQIRVYFNDDDLHPVKVKTGDIVPNPSVVDPAFYQLILTKDTVQPGDDVLIPTSSVSSISYDPIQNLATITYNQPIEQLAGAGTYRLRIGGRDVVANTSNPKTVTPTPLTSDPAGHFSAAPSLGSFSGSTSIELNEQIITTDPTLLPLDFPGSNFEPGHRDIQDESHVGGGDGSAQITQRFYNFALNRSYGLDAAGRPVSTSITSDQIARIREIFEFYSMQLGIDFVESESAGFTIVVGDLFPLGVQSGVGGVAGVAGGGLAIMDGAETWDNSFGAGFFQVAMHEIGHLLGLGHTYDLPPGTIMGAEGDLSSNPTLPAEWVFPGDADVIHAQYLYRPDNRDVDSYKFVVAPGKSGTFTAETFAERLNNSSNLDTYLTLLKETPTGYEVIAINNDSFSSDSFLTAKLSEGTYYISVTGKGNENFNPILANTGDGAVSEGNYRLKLDFKEDSESQSITDTSGTPIDGDGDGLAGGNFNFWFRTAAPVGVAAPGQPKTIYVEKGFGGVSTGSAAAPMNSLDLNNSVRWPVGFVQPGDIIRVVGSTGSDRLLRTSLDNPAYEVGRGGVGNAILSDGLTLDVPQGVTMMVDAGAIFKLRNTRISAGSSDAGVNKSLAALQVLGTPRQTANFTSYNDQSQGTDTNPLTTSPQSGDWGGLDFHNDVDRQEGRGDYERMGIFLNYVSHADIRFGGGQITVVSPSPTINPINLNESRPALLYNRIQSSADAAISADPDSFEETRFSEPRYQGAQNFQPDYDRVGPDIRGNMLTGNTANGLFVRTVTAPGQPLTELTTAARWNDTDITYILGENFIISGTPGGSLLETIAPDVSLVQTLDATGGTLTVGSTVRYKVDFVDAFGGLSIPSAATSSRTLTTNAVTLTNLPTATRDFVGRRLWRSVDNGVTYRLVAELDGDSTTYTDIGADLATLHPNPNATSSQRARLDARLQIDPGVVIKSTGSRIEVGIGAQLIAEGTADRKIIFTSRADDRFGAGGTFDTNGNQTSTNPGSGDWGGLVARHLSSISIDNALITFAGGITSISGGFAGFNAVEVHQAEARITNSVLESNASGLGGSSFTRDGRGPHDASVIFVTGSQPVIAENIIRNNNVSNTAVISINANALNTDNIQDRGRQSGPVNRVPAGLGNSGPLVDGNSLVSNGLNGMRVRGQTLTTATVWDDTDIVHILQSEVVVPDHHTYGGLRLQSKVDESLVVKLGTGAGLTALGRPLDITDRLGGSLQILGAPGFPVVMTSLADDTVGAGFDPTGRALVDTNNNGPSTGTPGSWRSIRLEPYTNDRNLDTTFEYEPDQIQDVGNNDSATTAQGIGALSPALNGGDENLRLGFTVHGSIAAPQDLDVYSFTGAAGTPIWIDIDQTNGSLDTVVELIDSSGQIIAQSNTSLHESSAISGLRLINTGTGYTNGTYLDVPLTGGTGSGALATITVAAGVVSSIVVTTPGRGYNVGNVLSFNVANAGGTGSGFTATVTSVGVLGKTGGGGCGCSGPNCPICSGYVNPALIDPNRVGPLDQNVFAPKVSFATQASTARDLYSVNPLDAGMRLILPGNVGGTNTYYVRVRSSNLRPGDPASKLQDPSQERAGITTGAYRLQVRLQQNDETAGSTVRFADIRFATNGIETNGMPAHSPLLGQVAETGDAANLPANNLPGLGNILNSDRGSVSLAGQLGFAGDVDVYSLRVQRDSIQEIGQLGNANHLATTFDIDYADGLGRADTSLWVYRIVNGAPVLILVGTDSNIADDRAAPNQGSDLDALIRGSVGSRDAFIGSAELPTGDYLVAVTNNSQIAAAMQQFQVANPTNPNIRLEPINSVNRLFVDRIATSSPDTAAGATPVLFNVTGGAGGIDPNNTVNWTLADVTTYMVRSGPNNDSELVFANALTGAQEAIISQFVRVNDVAMAPDGNLVGYEIPIGVQITDANAGNFHIINSIGAAGGAGTPTNASTSPGSSGIQTFTTQLTAGGANPTFAIQQRDQNGLAGGNTPQGDGILFNDITHYTQTNAATTLFMYGVGSRANGQVSFNMPILDANGGVIGIDTQVNFNATNIVYRLDPATGAAINPLNVVDRTGTGLVQGAGTQRVEFGRFLSGTLADNFTSGTVTGLAEAGGNLFAVSNRGEFFVAPIGDPRVGFASNFAVNNATTLYAGRLPLTTILDDAGQPIVFTGLTGGPRNLENGRFANMLFGTTANGTIWAFDTNGVKQPIFPGFSASMKSPTLTGTTFAGIDFSPLDVNLWHLTDRRDPDVGHGRTVPYDLSQLQDLEGDNSLYFGFVDGTSNFRQAGAWTGVYNVAGYQNSYNLPGGAHGAVVSNPIDLTGYSADDLPTLYFNYFLATENANSHLVDGDVRMRDAFRVYASASDGTWILLATNNSNTFGPDRLGTVDEFDNPINGYNGPYAANPIATQELFDNTGNWRQARTSLAPFAGQSNVRLRFEFSSGASFRTGNPLLGGVELNAVAGTRLADGQTFTMTPQEGVSAVGTRTFEFDYGLVLDLPGAASIIDGVSQLTVNGIAMTFSTTSNTGLNIGYLPSDSPTQIASRVRSRLPGILGISPGAINVHPDRGNILTVSNTGPTGVIREVENNNTPATAQAVDVWSLASNPDIANSTAVPHATILGSGDGSYDFYTFTNNIPNSFANFDIDYANFDSEILLFGPTGALLAENDNAAVDSGSSLFRDANLAVLLNATGVYTVAVARSVLGTGLVNTLPLQSGDSYQLHVSVQGQAVGSGTNVTSASVTSLPTSVIAALPGIKDPANVAIPVNFSMTDIQVRDAIRAQLAATYNNPLSVPTANASAVQAWPVQNSALRIFKFTVSNTTIVNGVTTPTSGLGLTTSRAGDQFGVHGQTGNRMDERAQNNAFEGVYIDDIIVGFAERGELVLNATNADANAGFVQNLHNPGRLDTFNIFQVETGAYQLNVRTSADYGITDPLTGRMLLARSYDTNDRLAQQLNIRVAENSGNSSGYFRDGMTFTLSDGTNQARFEFDVVSSLVPLILATDPAAGVASGNIPVRIRTGASPLEIATAIRDAINGPTAQGLLKITAALQGEMPGEVTPATRSARNELPIIELHGAAATNLSGGVDVSDAPDLIFEFNGVETGFGEDGGDTEREREQGQILLVGNTITNSSNFGILADAGARVQPIGGGVGPRPYPGAPANLPSLNPSGLAPGVVIVNNILANNTAGGIRVSGDEGNTGMPVPRQIARIQNNTIFAGTDGILVDGGASPTILNNVISNTTNGIRVTGASAVLGANTYKGNTNNTVGIGLGSFDDPMLAADPLFVSTTNRRFYLADGSRAIDSSIEALQERPELTQVKNSIGLPLSPMLAPDLDVTGQRRVDDPRVNSPAGLGGNVFKDRGAVDRSDFIGLNAIILQPQDNDSSLADVDRNSTYIQLTEGEIEFFSILLQDTNGTGPDESTVIAEGAVTLTENGRLLIPNTDYFFGYNANSRTIRLTPVAGIWRKDSVYEISLNNRTGTRLTLNSGAVIADGARYTIVGPNGSRTFEFDKRSPSGVGTNNIAVLITSGYTPYQVAAALSAAINSAGIGVTSYLQGDGTLMVVGATSVTASGASLSAPLTVGGIRDLAGNLLFPNRENSLTQFTIVMPDVELDYGDSIGVNTPTIKAPNSNVIPLLTNGNGARHALLPIDEPLLALGKFADAETDGLPSASLSGDDVQSMFSAGSLGAVTALLNGSATLTVNAAAITEGQQFTITDTISFPLTPVVFEFTSDATVTAGAIPVLFQVGDASSLIAPRVANAIVGAAASGRLDDIIAIVDPENSANVRVLANSGHQLNITTAAALTRLAIGDVSVTLTNVAAFPDGRQFDITDGSGNTVRFEINNTDPLIVPASLATLGTVPVSVDLATATINDIATAIAAAINGQIAGRRLVLGGAVANGPMLTFLADDEDGVRFTGKFNAASSPVVVDVTSTGPGTLDAWIDWNADGDFDDDLEQIFTGELVQPGVNTFDNLTTPTSAAIGFVTARFRLSTLGVGVGGVAIGGEVEDYLIEVVEGIPPVAVPDSYPVNEDVVLSVTGPGAGVLGNDTDGNNDPLAIPPILEPIFVWDANPATAAVDPAVDVSNGTLVLNRDGTFTYTPDLDFNGIDTFVYYAIDQRLRSNLPTTVTITVNPINDAPLGVNDTNSAFEDEVVVRSGDLFTANDLEHFRITSTASNADNERPQLLRLVDGGATIVSETTTDFGGIAGLGVRIAAKPNQGAYGIRVYVETADLGAGTAPTVAVINSTMTVTLNSNAASVSTLDDFIAAINGNAAAAALVNITVLNGAGSTFLGNAATAYSPVIVPPSGGTVSVTNNVLTYTPPAHYNNNIGGPAVLRLTIEDDGLAGPTAGQTSTSLLTINIAPVNDAPEFDWTDPKIHNTIEDGGDVVVPNFITNIMPGPIDAVDESIGPALVAENQQVSFDPPLIQAVNPELFAVQPRISPTGTLTYRLAPDVNRITPFPEILVRLAAADSGATGGQNVNTTIIRTFTIIPEFVNDAPEFTIPAVTGSLEDQGVVTKPGFITDLRKGPTTALDEVVQTLRYEVVFDPNAFTATGIPTLDLATGTLTYETAPHVNRFTGQDFNVTLTIIDDGGTDRNGADRTTKSFLIDVTELNDAPEYLMDATTTLYKEDHLTDPDAASVIANFITGIMPGPNAAVDEGPRREDQQITFEVRALDPSLFDSRFLPTITTVGNTTGTLTYRLAPDVNRVTPFPPILVEVIAVDTGAEDAGNAVPRNIRRADPRTFTILPAAVNDAPEFTIPAVTTSLEDVGVVTRAGFITDLRKGPVTALDEVVQTLRYEVIADRNAFTATGFPVFDLATGTLTYETAPHVNRFTGQDLNVTLTIIDDGGTDLDGDDRTSKTFLIDVPELNDAPEYVMPNFTSAFVEDPNALPNAPTVVPGFITRILPGPDAAVDEVLRENQLVTFAVRALDPTLFDLLPTISNDGTLTYRLARDVNQIVPFPRVLVEVIASDNGLNDPGNAVPRNINTAAPRTFTILPDPINDAPEFTIPAVVPSIEDEGLVTVVDFVTGARPGPITALDELAAQTLTITAEAFDPTAFTATGQPAIVLNQATGRGTLTFQTNSDVNSQTLHDLRIRVTLRDSGGIANVGDVDTTVQIFSLNVDPRNDAPIFTLPVPAEVTIDEDNESVIGQPITSIPFATGIVAGPPTAVDETTILATRQSVQFETVSVTNTGLFRVAPTLTPSGELQFVTAQDQNGQSVVVVRLVDSGPNGNGDVNFSAEQTLTINVRPINDAPIFDLPATVTSREDQGPMTFSRFATNVRPGPETATDEVGQFLRVNVRALDPAAFIDQPSIAADGTLTYRTAADVNSNMAGRDLRVEVFLDDDGVQGPPPHDHISDTKTFTIVVNPVNDAPSFVLTETEKTVREDEEQASNTAITQFVDFATSIARGPATATDEVTQDVSFEILSNTSEDLFEILPAISSTGVLSFKTAANRNGKALLVVRLVDSGVATPAPNDNDSPRQTFTISVSPINDAPEFDIRSSITVTEDAGLVSSNNFAFDVRRGPISAADENAQQIEFLVTALDPTAFAVQPAIGPDGTLTFQTRQFANRDNADLRVRVQLRDNGPSAPAPNNNLSAPRTFTIDATPVNNAPIADAFSVQISEEDRITIQSTAVLVGDRPGPTPDENVQSLAIRQVERTTAAGGIVLPVFNGLDIVSFEYIAPANFVGIDRILYVVTDNGVPEASGTGTITITLEGINDPPQFIRGADQVVFEDAPTIALTGWATDILPGPPASTDELSQVVTFVVTDNSRTDLFEVQPSISSNGTLSFKPAADANGTAVIRLRARDNGSNTFPNRNQSDEQTFTITINPVNDAPVFTTGGNVNVQEDSGPFSAPWASQIAAAAGLRNTPPTATDESAQVVDFSVSVDNPSLFSVQPTISPTGQLQFTPNSNAFGNAVLTVRATDRGPAGALDQNTSNPVTFTVSITPTNDRPVAVSDTLAANENTPLIVAAPGLLANDTDVDLPNDTLTVVAAVVTSSLGATVTINADGSIRYDASAVASIQQLTTGQSVQDSFVYQIRDAAPSTSDPATVFINVAGVNDAPVAVDDSYSLAVGQTSNLDVLLNDTDIDSSIDATTIVVSSLPAFGTVVVNQTGVIQYTPSGGFRGNDSFRYRVRDVQGLLSNEAVVNIVVNNAPTANDDSVSTSKNQAVEINVLGNDSDIDGTLDPSSVLVVLSPVPSGTATVLPNGRIRFTPANNFAGTVSFSYVVSDDLGTPSNVADVTVRVQNSRWQNSRLSLDVNNDTFISPIDALLIISYLNSGAQRDLRLTSFVPPPFIDTNGDEIVSPLDALLVIDFLNRNRRGSGEGEGESDSSATTYAMMVTPQQMVATVGAEVVQEIQAQLDASLLEVADEPVSGTVESTASMLAWFEEEDEDLLASLSCSAEDHDTASDVDLFFGDLGPKFS